MPLKTFDKGAFKWLLLLMLAPPAMMLITSGRRRGHRKGDLVRDDGRETTTSVVASKGSGATAASTTTSVITITSTPPAPATAVLGGSAISKLALSSPRVAVETQVALLRENRDEEFRQTFLPSVTISTEQIDACKKRLVSAVVKPDWEMAEDVLIDGHRVTRVSMFGKSLTGFHDLSGSWLADAVWCVPTGVP